MPRSLFRNRYWLLKPIQVFVAGVVRCRRRFRRITGHWRRVIVRRGRFRRSLFNFSDWNRQRAYNQMTLVIIRCVRCLHSFLRLHRAASGDFWAQQEAIQGWIILLLLLCFLFVLFLRGIVLWFPFFDVCWREIGLGILFALRGNEQRLLTLDDLGVLICLSCFAFRIIEQREVLPPLLVHLHFVALSGVVEHLLALVLPVFILVSYLNNVVLPHLLLLLCELERPGMEVLYLDRLLLRGSQVAHYFVRQVANGKDSLRWLQKVIDIRNAFACQIEGLHLLFLWIGEFEAIDIILQSIVQLT